MPKVTQLESGLPASEPGPLTSWPGERFPSFPAGSVYLFACLNKVLLRAGAVVIQYLPRRLETL